LTGDDEYRGIARETVGAFAGASHRVGVQVAEYGTAASRLVHEPLTVAVADEPGSDLHRAALRIADHEKVADPDADESVSPDLDRGTARVAGVDEPASDPESLMERVARLE
ncbi:thioredoxin domain-containing protein, partial [Halolamina salina]